MNLMPTNVPGIGSDPAFIRECFKLGEAKASTQPQRVGVLPMERGQRWVVVQWVENVPLRQDEYDAKRDQIAVMLYFQEIGEFVRNYYDPQQIRQRAAWEEPQARREHAAEEERTPTTPIPAILEERF